jgi:hypothetical protein
MLELELSGWLSMWNQSSVTAPPGALLRRMNQALKTWVNNQSSTWKLVRQRIQKERRGEGLRFDRENAHHP